MPHTDGIVLPWHMASSVPLWAARTHSLLIITLSRVVMLSPACSSVARGPLPRLHVRVQQQQQQQRLVQQSAAVYIRDVI